MSMKSRDKQSLKNIFDTPSQSFPHLSIPEPQQTKAAKKKKEWFQVVVPENQDILKLNLPKDVSAASFNLSKLVLT